jgi:polyvinyl alcohol dehydrogenase (cytochrome)
VKIGTGERVWFTRPPAIACARPGDPACLQAQSAAVTVIPGVVFSGATNGVLRAYSTKDGSIAWEYNTWKPFTTVNGVAAKGGQLNGPGPTIVAGTVFVTSGYGGLGGRAAGAGNVLLAFRAD